MAKTKPQRLLSFIVCFLLYFTPFVSYAFSFKPDPLTDQDIQQYIQAYANIATVSEQLTLEKKKVAQKNLLKKCQALDSIENKITAKARELGLTVRDDPPTNCKDIEKIVPVLACSACMDILTKEVKKAGYKNYKSFTYMDIRINLAMYAYYELQLAKLIADFSVKVSGADTPSHMSAEDYCRVSSIDLSSDSSNKKDKSLTVSKDKSLNKTDKTAEEQTCRALLSLGGYIQKLSRLALQISKRLLQKGDITKVGEHISVLEKALKNENLIDDYNHTGGGFDD